MSPERALVTGGAGFIGSALCRALLRHGHDVAVFDNLSFGRRVLLPEDPRCAFIEGDIRDGAALDRAFATFRPELVFHLAALHFIPYCNEHPIEAIDVNVNGTRAVFDACRRARPRFVLFTSTAAVYPLHGGPFSEDHAADPVDVYGYTKRMGEDLARLFHLETATPVRIARLFNAFGPDDTNPHLIPDIAAQVRAESGPLRLGNLEPVRDYVHVDDVAAALILLAERGRSGLDCYNVGSGRGYSVREVVHAFERGAGRTLTIVGEAGRMRAVERPELVADTSRIRRDTGWTPAVDLDRGLRDLLATPSRLSR